MRDTAPLGSNLRTQPARRVVLLSELMIFSRLEIVVLTSSLRHPDQTPLPFPLANQLKEPRSCRDKRVRNPPPEVGRGSRSLPCPETAVPCFGDAVFRSDYYYCCWQIDRCNTNGCGCGIAIIQYNIAAQPVPFNHFIIDSSIR